MNSFGHTFRISLFGASHTPVLGVVIDGCPAGIALDTKAFEPDLARRKGGAPGTTSRVESDIPYIESGCEEGFTTGNPIRIVFDNRNVRPEDYEIFKTHPRPGHADWVAQQKYGSADAGQSSDAELRHNCDAELRQNGEHLSGGGIFSGRMTLPLTAAGVAAKRFLQKEYPDIRISARLLEIGGHKISGGHFPTSGGHFLDSGGQRFEGVAVAAAAGDSLGCGTDGRLDDALAKVVQVAAAGDSLGGVVECRAEGVPVGWGEPFFDSVESCISHIIFSIPGIKGIEFGAGFASARMCGSEHNDRYIDAQGHTATNHAGGISGGITNGNELIFRVAVRPTPSIALPQETFDFAANQTAPLAIQGRHDTCFALRLPVVIEAVTSIVLTDFALCDRR